ncbi:MAG: hypothetical protein JST08_05755 [Actinobacteria bacterium]|nr:hypothetical protein [Actinomycetota bacterium]
MRENQHQRAIEAVELGERRLALIERIVLDLLVVIAVLLGLFGDLGEIAVSATAIAGIVRLQSARSRSPRS